MALDADEERARSADAAHEARLREQAEAAGAEAERLRAECGAAAEREASLSAALDATRKEVAALRDAEETSRRALAAEMWSLRESHQAELRRVEAALDTERRRATSRRASNAELLSKGAPPAPAAAGAPAAGAAAGAPSAG